MSKNGLVTCCRCARSYTVDEGIIDFRQAVTEEGALDSVEALPVIEAATPEAWSDAVGEYLCGRGGFSDSLDALTAHRRQAWKVFLDLAPDRRLLCLGCGPGAAVQSLAPHAGQIYVLEQSIDTLRFVQQRLTIFAPQDDAIFLAGGDAIRLPFAAGSFDGVILAEPAGFDLRHPLLEEIHRVLCPEGQLLVLADNRFSLSLPAGWWDRWAGATWPLPQAVRTLGLLAVWWRRRSGPQSLPSLCRLLGSAGFSEREVFGMWPGRSQLEELIPLRNDQALVSSNGMTSWKQRVRRQAFFLPAHCVVAQASGRRRHSSYERILSAAAKKLADDREMVPLRAERLFLTRKDKMAILAQSGAESVVLRIPLGPAAAAAEEHHATMIAQLAASHPGVAPRPLAEGRVDGIDYRVETALPGTPLKRRLRERGTLDYLDRVSALLDTLNPETSLRRGNFEGASYRTMVEERLERLFHVFPNSDQQERLRDFFRKQLYDAPMSFGLLHGDFSNSNIYLSDATTGIIDWEAASLNDLPILDAINYLESSLRPRTPGYSLAEGIFALAFEKLPTAEEERFLFERYERLDIDSACHAGLVYLSWLRAIDFLLPYWLRFDIDSQRRYIHKVVETLLEHLSAP